MLPAALLAGRAVPLFAARMWIIAAMPPGEALNLKPCSDHTGFQVHIRPAETKGFSLPYAKRKSYRPSSAVSLVSGDIQDAASLLRERAPARALASSPAANEWRVVRCGRSRWGGLPFYCGLVPSCGTCLDIGRNARRSGYFGFFRYRLRLLLA